MTFSMVSTRNRFPLSFNSYCICAFEHSSKSCGPFSSCILHLYSSRSQEGSFRLLETNVIILSFEGVEHCFQDMFFSPQMDEETWIQRKNLAETSDNCQVSQVHGFFFFYRASLPPFKSSVPGWDNSENLHSYLQVALPSSAHSPQNCFQDYPWDAPYPSRHLQHVCLGEGGCPSLVGFDTFCFFKPYLPLLVSLY